MNKTTAVVAILLSVFLFLGVALWIDHSTQSAQKNADKIYSIIQGKVAMNITQAQSVLTDLRDKMQASQKSGTPCHKTLGTFMEQHSRIYDVFLKVERNGDLTCTPKATVSGVNFSDRVYYQRAMETRAFSVGEFLIGKVSKLPVLAVTLPVLDADNAVDYILVAGIKTEWLQEALVEAASVDKSLLIELQDTSGTLLRYFADGSIAEVGEGRKVELIRLPVFKGLTDAEIVIFQRT